MRNEASIDACRRTGRRTGRIRIRKGQPGTTIPTNFGLEEEFVFISSNADEVWHEWRPLEVAEHDA